VETEAQATMLRAAGCEVVQGFFFGRPQPLMLNGDKLQALVTDRKSASLH
jgi:EAL domain-containing protein (putative c-di-GMP-specific phosphodiesterase class I)